MKSLQITPTVFMTAPQSGSLFRIYALLKGLAYIDLAIDTWHDFLTGLVLLFVPFFQEAKKDFEPDQEMSTVIFDEEDYAPSKEGTQTFGSLRS